MLFDLFIDLLVRFRILRVLLLILLFVFVLIRWRAMDKEVPYDPRKERISIIGGAILLIFYGLTYITVTIADFIREGFTVENVLCFIFLFPFGCLLIYCVYYYFHRKKIRRNRDNDGNNPDNGNDSNSNHNADSDGIRKEKSDNCSHRNRNKD